MKPEKKAIFIFLGTLFLGLILSVLAFYWDTPRELFQNKTIPSPLLAFGETGKILRKSGTIAPLENKQISSRITTNPVDFIRRVAREKNKWLLLERFDRFKESGIFGYIEMQSQEPAVRFKIEVMKNGSWVEQVSSQIKSEKFGYSFFIDSDSTNPQLRLTFRNKQYPVNIYGIGFLKNGYHPLVFNDQVGWNQRVEDIGIGAFIFVISASLLSAFAISSLYTYFFSRRATGSQVHRAFPLLSIAITVIFITIQFSLPLSLGLLGALSIVRFRTPIKEPEEIGFIMLVIASSLSCATFNIIFTVILAVFAILALIVMEWVTPMTKGNLNGGMLVVRGPKNKDPGKTINEIQRVCEQWLRKGSLHSITCEEDICITFVFHKTRKSDISSLTEKISDTYPEFNFNLMVNRSTTI